MRTLRILPLAVALLLNACGGGDELQITTTGLANATVGASYTATLTASGGSKSGYKWTVTEGSPPQGLSLGVDGKITGTPATAGAFTFTVQVTDSDGATQTKPLSLTVDPTGGAEPVIDTATLPNGEVGVPYDQALAASGGAGGYVWTLSTGSLPDGLALDANGRVSGTPLSAGGFTFTLQVADADGKTDSQTYTLTISASVSFRITTTVLPNGAVGMAYSATVETVNASGAVVWGIAGTLPDGLSIGTDGASTMITGTPSTAGVSTFTVAATDSSGTVTAELSIEILMAPEPLSIETMRVPTGTVGVAYSATILAQNGSNMGYAWTVTGALPDGLTIGATGTPATTVSGTPTAAGTVVVTINVMDSDGGTASVMVDFTIRQPPLQISPATVPGAAIGVPYSQTLTAAGGSGTGYQWNIVGGSLPAGITLEVNGATATLAGTPTTLGPSTVDIELTDDAGGSLRRTYDITVYPPLTIDSTLLGNGYVGTATSAMVRASGGSGAGYVWSIGSGTLPPGMQLVSTGTTAAVEGTPTAAGVYQFEIQVTDSAGLIATQVNDVEIYDALEIRTLQLPTATTAVAYDEDIVATGGAPGALTWTLVSGALPDGLALGTAAGNSIPLSGVPTTLGSYSFEMRVDDSFRASTMATVAITVYQPLRVDTVTLPAGADGVPYSTSIAASGGSTLGYTWSIVGTGPSGLTLLPNGTPTTLLTGTPSGLGTFTFTVSVVDSVGETAQGDLTIEIVPPLQILTTLIPGRAECAAGQTTIQTTGGTGAGHTWTISGGAIPTGWVLDPAGSPSTTVSGRASGPSTSSFTLTVTDDAGLTDSQPYVVTITPDANAQRNAVIVGDLTVNNETSVFLVDVCTDTPGPLTQISPPGGTTGDVSTTADLTQLSPNGNLVAFSGDLTTDGLYDLYVVNLNAVVPTAVNVTNFAQAGSTVTDIFWSPNSNLIAYIADPVLDGRDELYLVNVTNPAAPTAPIRISRAMVSADNDVSASDVFWSPNSQRIVYQGDADTDGVFELYYVNVTNPAAPTLALEIHPDLIGGLNELRDCDDDVFWAPSSSGVLFRCDLAGPGIDELWYTNLSSPQPSAVRVNSTPYVGEDVGADDYRFAPTGARAFYLADELNNNSQELFIVNFDSNGDPLPPQRAMFTLSAAQTVTHARWSPDGTRLAVRGDLETDDRFELYVINVGGTLPSIPTRVSSIQIAGGNIDAATTDGTAFEWAPNGMRLAYIADQDVDNVDRAYIVQVAALPYNTAVASPIVSDVNLDVASIEWSPNSQWLAIRGEFTSDFQLELALTDATAAPYTPVLATLPLTGGQDVSSGDGSFFFRRDSAGLFFEADMIVDNDTESWMVDLFPGAPQVPVRMHPLLPASGDVELFRVEP